MKIRLLSDLHTEFRLPYKTAAFSAYFGEDVLVLAGDIASGSSNTIDVIKHFKSTGFNHIIYVPGNHEYYGTSLADFDAKMRDKCAKLENVHFLNKDSIEIDGVLFVGATLWTDFNNSIHARLSAMRKIACFRLIKDFTLDTCVKLNISHASYIKQAYENRGDRKVVVITHFLPALACVSPHFKENDPWGLNDYFAPDLDADGWISSLENTTWLFGHTHDVVDIKLGNTRLVCNPHGYYGSQEGKYFNPFKIIEV